MAEPLHLVEIAAQRLRKDAKDAPEAALLADEMKALPEEQARPAERAQPDHRAPILAVDVLAGAGMIVSQGHRERVAEEFRIAAEQIIAGVGTPAAPGVASNLVMVTSALPREGKSFTALNLAADLALRRKRSVVLVDCDVGPGSLTERLGLSDETGILDLVSGTDQVGEASYVHSKIDRLVILPIGGGTDVASRTLASAHYPVGSTIAALAHRYAESLFIVDTPACLEGSEAAAIASVAGQALLVVEAERTRRRQIEAALDLIDACQNIKLILNKTRMTTSGTFGIQS